ncbi:MAG: phosphatase PAP2 family protein [Campylobacterales bacterium]|nr:phosphatase PAP2 family protein [Campylobacterales bacterium]
MIFSRKQIFLFVSIMTLLIVLSYFYIDKSVSLYFIEHAETYKTFGKRVSALGESHWYIGAGVLGALFYSFVKKNRLYKMRFLFLLYVNLFSGLISVLLKPLFGRLRPWKLENGEDSYGFLIAQNPDFTLWQNIEYQISMLVKESTHYSSFPSGHTTTSMAVFTYLMILFPKYTYVWIGITLLSLTSRIFANDHFISDLFAGIIVGVLSTLFIYSKMKDSLEKDTH